MPMLDQVRQTIVDRGLLTSPQHVLVAVSGGADSIAMLYALFWLRHELGLQLTVAHLDHGIRADSHEDAALVRAACRDLNLPLEEQRTDVPAMRGRSGNLEEVARRARHAFLENASQRADAQAIALGHTRTDLAETLLLHLLRGAGPAGLRGMTPSRPPYIRPLVDCSRRQTREFCRAHDLPFREDPTNQDVRLTRNAVRLELLPKLKKFNPRAEHALARAAQLWAEAQEGLTWAAHHGLELATEGTGLDLNALARFPDSVQRLVLRQAAADALGGGCRPTKA
ncbi:MAG: tRNA lysidine(34) synthetase TilS, partial [Candidatus Bipolaricaulota bacterium]